MKTLNQKLVIVLLLTAMASLTASVALAAYPPWYPLQLQKHHPGPNPWHPMPYPVPFPRPIVRPIIVNAVSPVYTTYYQADTTNPAPAADIRLVNPAENRVTLKYTLNGGEVQSLAAGYSVQINQAAIIEYDRGGGMGRARLALRDGTYKFKPTNGGYWRLFRETETSNEAYPVNNLAANPLPSN